MTCKVCGTKSRITYSEGEYVKGDVSNDGELELRERVEEFVRLRNYTFSDLWRELVIQLLLEKRKKYGDFYCPCKVRTVLENVVPMQRDT